LVKAEKAKNQKEKKKERTKERKKERKIESMENEERKGHIFIFRFVTNLFQILIIDILNVQYCIYILTSADVFLLKRKTR
jgi:hypothetical protein